MTALHKCGQINTNTMNLSRPEESYRVSVGYVCDHKKPKGRPKVRPQL
jgi:hypothetical protein